MRKRSNKEEITINREQFLQVLFLVGSGLSKKSITIEQSSHFVFMGDQIATFNNEVCVAHPFNINFNCTVPARELEAIVERAGGEMLTLALTSNCLAVRGKDSRLTLVCQGKKRYIDLSSPLSSQIKRDGSLSTATI